MLVEQSACLSIPAWLWLHCWLVSSHHKVMISRMKELAVSHIKRDVKFQIPCKKEGVHGSN